MSPPFHLSAIEFDAYLADRAGSNAYSRPRIEVKQRALAWARRVVARLSDIGITVDLHATDEHPSLRNHKRVDCQWLFFWRDEHAREELERLLDQGRTIAEAIDDPSPYARHAFLALRIDAQTVEVCFAVHPEAKVDVDNLRARLAASAKEGEDKDPPPLAAELTAALRALPEEFQIGVGSEGRVSCGTVTLEAIAEMLVGAGAGHIPLWIGWSVPRETAISHAETIGEQLEDALVALAPVYRLVAWSPENDHIGLEARLASAREERARALAERAAENERWEAERAAMLEASRERARARGEGDKPARKAADGSRRATLASLFRAPSPAAKSNTPRKPTLQAPPPRADEPARGGEAKPSPEREAGPGAVEVGSRVRVCAGPFAEKLGVVSELDGRGGARVLLGLLSTRLDLSDLEPISPGRDRPALQSSHRRPAPPAPRKAR